jgi:hypothetical protein
MLSSPITRMKYISSKAKQKRMTRTERKEVKPNCEEKKEKKQQPCSEP